MALYIKTLLGNAGIYGVGSVINSSAGFILIPFYINNLTSAEYGYFAIAEIWLNILLIVFTAGLNIVILSEWPKHNTKEKNILSGNLLILIIIYTLISCLFIYFGLTLFGYKGSTEILKIVISISAIESIWGVISTIMRAESMALKYVLYSFIRLLFSLVLTVYFIKYLGFKGEGILYGRLVGDVIIIFILFPMISNFKFNLDIKPAIALVKKGLPLIPATLIVTVITMSPRYFLEQLGTTEDVGIFAMSAKIAGLLSVIVVQPFSMAWMVSIFNIQRSPKAKNIYSNIILYYLLIGLSIALLFYEISPYIIMLLEDESFPLSQSVIGIIGFSTLLLGFTGVINIGPYLENKISSVLPAYFISLIVAMIFGAVLSLYYGVIGAALSLTITYAVQLILLSRISQNLYRVPYQWSKIIPILICALIILSIYVI